ncbi:putative iron-regulated membrane protein [Kitasatospora gansuensis]|uniref:Putative iron-regulated membrane protein n=1 Tax=Kitasatospora gansuensis TaxID=258050 RepID=A0A7W7S8L3_9ACTN|nr:PepSY domain-containing protein [Kitasatospora gansuensis]MBB4945919.1 putative iron-regulated membrane protein [Kitasatospora gansuensis]
MLSETERPPTSATPAPASAWAGLRPLLLRLHFYAGVLIAPFLLVAAVSGLLYAGSYQIERFVYSDQLTVSQVGTAALPLSRQIAAATAAHPEGKLALVRTSDDPEATTQVLLNVPALEEGRKLAVFVDPYTAEVRGALKSYGSSGALPFRAWLSELHANLQLGEPGRIYSELAASWLWVVVLGGLALWFGRRRKRYVRPEGGLTGRRRSLSWHGVIGLWAAVGLLGLSATGLTWSTYAGEHIEQLRTSLSWTTPALATATGGGDHSAHEEHSGSGGTPVGVDQVMAAAAAAGIDGPVEIVPPKGPGKAYAVKEIDKQWPVRLDQVAVDPTDATVSSELRFADYPLGAKLTRFGIDLHMGVAFGLANELALIALAAGLIAMTLLGYRMWWHRRPGPRAFGRPYPAGAWRQSPRAAAALALAAIAVGWFLPLLGISLAAFLAVDLLLGLRRTK